MPVAERIRSQTGAVFLKQITSPAAVSTHEITCAQCSLRSKCLAGGVSVEDPEHVENIVLARRPIKRGERLFSAGEEFKSVYAVRSGFFKTSLTDGQGREQVTGFFMGGDLLGMDGWGSGRYQNIAVALEDSDVCAMPYSLIEAMAGKIPSLQRRLHALLAQEILRGHAIMMLLGTMRAEERLAAFLIDLSRRLLQRGYSGSSLVLRMRRDEIGSYLGLKLETVSRVLSALQKNELIQVQQKQISILDIEGLKHILWARD